MRGNGRLRHLPIEESKTARSVFYGVAFAAFRQCHTKTPKELLFMEALFGDDVNGTILMEAMLTQNYIVRVD